LHVYDDFIWSIHSERQMKSSYTCNFFPLKFGFPNNPSMM